MSRRGRWSAVEEEYAHTLMEAFKEGILDVAEGTSLRSYLSMKLSCDPMRISKKFSGLTTTGRHYFKATEDTMEHRVKLKRLQVLEYQFAQQYHMCGMQSGWNRTPDMAVFQPFYPQQSYQVQYQQDYQNMSYMFPNIPSMSGYAARQNLTSKSCKMLSTDTNSTTGGSDSDVSKSSSIDGDNYSNSSKRVRCSDKANFPFSKTPQFVPFSNQGTCESLSESEEQESNAHEEPEASTSSRPPLHQNNSSQAINNNNLNMNSNLSGGRVVDTAYGPMLVFCEVNSSGVTVQRGVPLSFDCPPQSYVNSSTQYYMQTYAYMQQQEQCLQQQQQFQQQLQHQQLQHQQLLQLQQLQYQEQQYFAHQDRTKSSRVRTCMSSSEESTSTDESDGQSHPALKKQKFLVVGV